MMKPSLVLAILALLASSPSRSLAGKIRGYDKQTIATVLTGKQIVVPAGCPEEPRLDETDGKIFARHFPGVSEEDSAFRGRVTRSFRAGLAKAAGKRLVFDSLACRTGDASKLVTDLGGKAAMLDGSRVTTDGVYLALGIFHFEGPTATEEMANSAKPALMGGQRDHSLGARLDFGIYDPLERILVYHDSKKVAAADNYLVVEEITPENWEDAAFKLGTEIGKVLMKLPGK
ncbi:MAG: hypothetical protein H6686_01265 [Fibrobacteria bacterium]|nr:hypothetical protein [Fibrobacteria bacterium]